MRGQKCFRLVRFGTGKGCKHFEGCLEKLVQNIDIIYVRQQDRELGISELLSEPGSSSPVAWFMGIDTTRFPPTCQQQYMFIDEGGKRKEPEKQKNNSIL